MAVVTTHSRARANPARLLDRVAKDRDTVVIERRGGDRLVMIAEAELCGLEETANLLRSPKNAERLLSALARARTRSLIDAILGDPFTGIGKPERLKHLLRGAWPRRLTQEHRIVYLVLASRIDFLQARYRYWNPTTSGADGVSPGRGNPAMLGPGDSRRITDETSGANAGRPGRRRSL